MELISLITHKTNERKLSGGFRFLKKDFMKEKVLKEKVLKESVGVDIAMNDYKVVFMAMKSNLSVVVKGSKTFSNDPKGHSELIEWVKRKSSGSCPLTFTMEATGVYYEELAYYLTDLGNRIHVVLPNQVKKYGQSLGIKSKTDAIDARVIAQMGIERELKEWKPFSPNFRILKSLTRERDMMICGRTVAKNHLHAFNHQGKSLENSIKRVKTQIEFYDNQVEEIESEIEEIVKSDEDLCKRLSYVQSIKGVALLTAVTIVSETNGFETFNNIKQVVSYAGLDVKIRESGKWKGKSKISKCGNKYIRKSLYFPALTKIRCDKKTGEFYERLSKKKGINMVASVAVQRKLLALIYTLWKKQEMFDPEY